MGRKILNLSDDIASKAKQDLSLLPFGKMAVKLQAIIALQNNSMTTVANVFGYGRKTLYSWLREFTLHGIDGLKPKDKKPRSSKLSQEEINKIIKRVKENKKNWTLGTLKKEIENRFGKNISTVGIWKILKKENIAYITPRPMHYIANKEEQDKFKKN